MDYVSTKYATAVGGLVMMILYGSYETFDESEFAVTAGAEYLTIESAH